MKGSRRFIAVAFSAVVWLYLAGCADKDEAGQAEAEGLSGKLVLTGSSTVAPLAAEIGKRFESLHPGVRVDVQSGGSSRGVSDTRQGLADIGMVSRALKETEADLTAFTIARDGIGIILNQANPVAELSESQIMDIFTGKITQWGEVGGNDALITVVNKAEGRSTLELFLHHFRLENSAIRAHVVIGDNEQGIKTVAGNPDAIGYVSVGTAEYDIAQGVPIKLLPLNGIPATTQSVAENVYPLSRVLNLVTNAPPEGVTKAFIGYASSPAVEALVRGQSFVPLVP